MVAEGRLAEALPELERGVFLRRLWGQPLDLVDSLIALAPRSPRLGDRDRAEASFAEAEAIVAALRRRRACCRDRLRRRAARSRPGAELTERELTSCACSAAA